MRPCALPFHYNITILATRVECECVSRTYKVKMSSHSQSIATKYGHKKIVPFQDKEKKVINEKKVFSAIINRIKICIN